MIDLNVIERQCKSAIDNGYGHLPVIACGNAVKLMEVITRLHQAEKDAARYRFMRDSGKFKETGVEFDAAVDKAMEILGGIE